MIDKNFLIAIIIYTDYDTHDTKHLRTEAYGNQSEGTKGRNGIKYFLRACLCNSYMYAM